MTDYEMKLERMNPFQILNEIEDAVEAINAAKPIAVDFERYRIVRRVLARRLTLAANLAA